MTFLTTIAKDLILTLNGKREISFYFQTLKASDSLLAIWYSMMNFIGIRASESNRNIFLKKVHSLFKYKEAFLFGSARSALYSLLHSLDFDSQSEVILTGFTCDVVPNAVIQAGLKPIYVDIDPSNYCMSPLSLIESITKQTKVVVIQHTYGIPADIDSLIEIAHKHSLYVIEDCAVSLGSRYNGKLTGRFGDAAIFSFELSKTITSCRGGLLTINNNKMEAIDKVENFYKKGVPEQNKSYRIKILLQLGISGLLHHPRVLPLGKYFNALLFKLKLFSYSTLPIETKAKRPENYLLKLSPEQCAILSRQWDRLPETIAQSKSNMGYYLNRCEKMLNRDFVQYIQKHDINFIRFPIRIPNRDKLVNTLNENRIELGLWFTAPISSVSTNQKLFYYTSKQCEISEDVSSSIINLPVHPRIKHEDMDRILNGLKNNA